MPENRPLSPADGGGNPWFLVANTSHAQAWVQRVGAPGYDSAREWDNPGARVAGRTDKDREIEFEGSVKAEVASDPQDLFGVLGRDIAFAMRSGEVTGLWLIAPAQILPKLRDALPHDLHGRIMGEATGDLTKMPRKELFGRLDALRREPRGPART